MEKKLEQRPLGNQGLIVSAQGLGAMGMTAFYKCDGTTEEEKLRLFGKCLEIGINFIDTAFLYHNFTTGEINEELIGKALKIYGRNKFIIATKTGIVVKDGKIMTSSEPEVIKSQLAESLRRLDTDYIDLYYLHRIDRSIPIEDTMKLLLELKDQGKIKYVGLSECSAEELERAHSVFPVSAIQMEWSLHSRDIEKEIVPMARKLGVGIVAYSPLGRGLLSRTIKNKEDVQDWRANLPRFNGEEFEKNLNICESFEKYAEIKGHSPAQVALAWVHSRGKDVFPIPGTKSMTRLEENSLAASIALTSEECEEIEALVPFAEGERYDKELMKVCHNSA